ncbi:phosphoglucosamine mutase [candidate division KSB1 bacterium]|nr:phosphoglucosamine mutase [candidate division KSB1 bacterium]MBL7095737.1 phosphoglucosamine mutase [candidate division KSB1 bacterium]
MADLMVSISGIRGIVGDGLTSQNVMQFAQAFGNYLGNGEVVVGRDSRVTGPMFQHAVFAGLMAAGCDIIDIGVCSTPTAQMAVEKLKARGGIVITASHNPIQWNALKLLDSTGMFLDETQGSKVIESVENGEFQNVQWDQVGKIESYESATEDHLKAIFKLDMISPDQIAKKKFKVVIDCVNGAGGTILPSLMQQLGCETVFMNEETTGLFPRSPEPLPENLTDLCEKVISEKADIGFAVDPDVDRLAIVSEKGKPLGEEYTLVMAIKYILKKKDGPIVVNASVTQAVDDLAEKYNAEVIRTKVGEIHVAKKMKQVKAAIGGEGNGGVILPELHLGRDAPLGIALTLQQLAEFKGTISELHQSLPQYFQSKNRIEIKDMDVSSILDTIVKNHKKDNIDKTDGIKILWADGWVHIRPSNTEPIIRIYSEAKSVEEADALSFKFIKEIKEIQK